MDYRKRDDDIKAGKYGISYNQMMEILDAAFDTFESNIERSINIENLQLIYAVKNDFQTILYNCPLILLHGKPPQIIRAIMMTSPGEFWVPNIIRSALVRLRKNPSSKIVIQIRHMLEKIYGE